jgi:hypothetical protein
VDQRAQQARLVHKGQQVQLVQLVHVEFLQRHLLHLHLTQTREMLGLTQKLVKYMFITILFGLNQRLQTWVTRETLVRLDQQGRWESKELRGRLVHVAQQVLKDSKVQPDR